MPERFGFSANTLVTPTYLSLTQLSPGSGTGVNNPGQFSALAPDQSIESSGDVDVFAVTLLAGQRYSFDVDAGAGDSAGGSVDLELELIDQEGRLVLSDDGAGSLDPGSASTLDPLLTVSVNRSGTYFVAVHAQAGEYVDGTFSFDTDNGGGTGDYRLVVSTPSLPPITTLSSDGNSVAFGAGRDNVRAAGGDDVVTLGGGSDLAAGGAGRDALYGGTGGDELSGDGGSDRLEGGSDDDVLVGGADGDRLYGGDNDDALSGGLGGDALSGGGGGDTLWGEDGRDIILAGGGDDFVRGGDGVDRMQGNGGADTFHFLRGEADFDQGFREDRILDFGTADRIDLSDLRLGALAFRGEAGFTGANQVRVVDYREGISGLQEVRVNLDSNTSTVEVAILVDTEGFTLRAEDFFLF